MIQVLWICSPKGFREEVWLYFLLSQHTLSILHTHGAKRLQRNLCDMTRPVPARTSSLCFNCTTVTEGQLLAVGTTVSKEACFSVFLYRKGVTGIFNVVYQDKDSTAKAHMKVSALSQVSSVTWGRLKPSPWISSCYLERLSGAAERQCVPPSSVPPQPACLPRYAPGVPQPRSCAPEHPHPLSF